MVWCVSVERSDADKAPHLCDVVCALPQGFKNLFVVFQVDVSEHVGGHLVSFAEVGLQGFFVDLPLKLRYDWSRLNQADANSKNYISLIRY